MEEAAKYGTLNALAEKIGCSWSTVKKHHERGLFKPISRGEHKGKFDLDECAKLYGRVRDPEGEATGGLRGDASGDASPLDPSSPFMRARTAKAMVELETRELRLKQAKGELISRDEARSACLAVVHEIKTRLEGLPSAAAPLVHGALSVAEAETLLRGQVRLVLAEVAKLGAAV